MPARLPALLAAPPAGKASLLLTNARLLDGTGAPARERASVLVRDGRIAAIDGADPPADCRVLDVGGRTLMPGLVDAHAHLTAKLPAPAEGAEPLLSGTAAHVVAAHLAEALRRGVTTIRDVGSYGSTAVEARQAMRLGAFRGPRLLTCGRIISATSPGGRFFDGMYREADGPDDIRRAVREQLRHGADFVKVMTTGARSVELEDPDPAQLTNTEVETLTDEAHRLGYRVAAHAEGLAGTQIAIEAGIDTIEHGMYLNQRTDLLERMARTGQVLVPTLSCFYGVAGTDERGGSAASTWSPLLVELARHNLEQADRTLAAARAAGVKIALGHDWMPFYDSAVELERMVHHGMPAAEALVAATATGADALGLADQLGTVQAGRIADLVVVDGDPLSVPGLLRRRERIWLVLQLGEPVAGVALEREPVYA
ncbi:MAG TPA: amidohydrolase family protein [Solirubrobacteraceae bacterium]|nr:amidohydrolase family protein [Solirubrobacteraceae bacterium]